MCHAESSLKIRYIYIYIRICICCHFLTLVWYGWLKSFLVEDNDSLIMLYIQYHGYCWPGDWRSQGINSYAIETLYSWKIPLSIPEGLDLKTFCASSIYTQTPNIAGHQRAQYWLKSFPGFQWFQINFVYWLTSFEIAHQSLWCRTC